MIWHAAFTFDSHRFHAELALKIMSGNQLRLDILQNMAISAMAVAPQDIRDILWKMRYDEEWLDDPDGDQSQANLWYTILLVHYFHPAPSLSNNRSKTSSVILEDVLPYAGWSRDEIINLILGKDSNTLFESNEYSLFSDTFTIIGCLSYKDVKTLFSHLQDTQKYFLEPSEKIIEKLAMLHIRNNNALARLKMAYEDAFDMLQAALNRNEDLYLYRDW